jgi:transglutaminase-like putative cysteine protease
MIHYKIQYEAENKYDSVVTEAIFEFLVVPSNDNSQIVFDSNIKNSLGDETFTYKNIFGFDIVRIRPTKPFNEFKFTANARVDKLRLGQNISKSVVSPESELHSLKNRDFLIDNHLYLQMTKLTSLSAETLIKIPRFKAQVSLFDFLTDLTKYVYAKLVYTPNTTTVKTTAEEAFKLETGVCQDFAHLFLAIARQSNIPCRYVSGYTNHVNGFRKSPSMDAWVEAYIPGAGWAGFDPTNNRLVDENYIKVAHGVDYKDCSPIRGVLKTNGENTTTYTVIVTQQ